MNIYFFSLQMALCMRTDCPIAVIVALGNEDNQ